VVDGVVHVEKRVANNVSSLEGNKRSALVEVVWFNKHQCVFIQLTIGKSDFSLFFTVTLEKNLFPLWKKTRGLSFSERRASYPRRHFVCFVFCG
jgi:hypothetical protein